MSEATVTKVVFRDPVVLPGSIKSAVSVEPSASLRVRVCTNGVQLTSGTATVLVPFGNIREVHSSDGEVATLVQQPARPAPKKR